MWNCHCLYYHLSWTCHYYCHHGIWFLSGRSYSFSYSTHFCVGTNAFHVDPQNISSFSDCITLSKRTHWPIRTAFTRNSTLYYGCNSGDTMIFYSIPIVFGRKYIYRLSVYFCAPCDASWVRVYHARIQAFSKNHTRNGFPRMMGMLFRAVFWSFLLMPPLLVILYGGASFLFSCVDSSEYGLIFLATLLMWFAVFLLVSIPWVLIFSILTVHYMLHTQFSQENFMETFHFVKTHWNAIPRFKDLRFIFWKKWLFITLVCITIIAPIFLSLLLRVDSPISENIAVIAHRGYLLSGSEVYTENTISSIVRAHDMGAHIVEIDVYENRDGTLVLSHDPTLRRIANDPRAIADMGEQI